MRSISKCVFVLRFIMMTHRILLFCRHSLLLRVVTVVRKIPGPNIMNNYNVYHAMLMAIADKFSKIDIWRGK